MAKGKSLLSARGKRKAPRVSEIEKQKIVSTFYGEKPPPISDRARFLNWCNFTVDTATSRQWLEEYLSPSGRSASAVPNEWINTSVCHRARLKTLGAPFTETQDQLLEEGIRDILAHARVVEEDDGNDKPTIQDRVREKASNLIAELEGMIDDGLTRETFDLTAWYHQNNVSPMIASRILAKYVPKKEEIDLVLTEEDEQVNEAYSGVDEEEIFRLRELYYLIVDETDAFIKNQKRAKVARKPKPVSLEKKLKHVNDIYLKHSKEWNITSIDPSKIVGAKELWTLNVRYKLLTVFRADNMGGQLDVSRCKVTGFNPNDSQTYRLGRGKKQFTVVDQVMKSTRSNLKKVVSELNTSDYLLERINENTVLLRVF